MTTEVPNLIHKVWIPTTADLQVEWDENLMLSAGYSEFKGGVAEISEFLNYWQGFANRGQEVPLPETITVDSLTAWASTVFQTARDAEISPYNAPNAYMNTEDENVLIFVWYGTWTPNRWVSIRIELNPEGSHKGEFCWDSGTGRRSNFLNVEAMLSLDSVEGYWHRTAHSYRMGIDPCLNEDAIEQVFQGLAIAYGNRDFNIDDVVEVIRRRRPLIGGSKEAQAACAAVHNRNPHLGPNYWDLDYNAFLKALS